MASITKRFVLRVTAPAEGILFQYGVSLHFPPGPAVALFISMIDLLAFLFVWSASFLVFSKHPANLTDSFHRIADLFIHEIICQLGYRCFDLLPKYDVVAPLLWYILGHRRRRDSKKPWDLLLGQFPFHQLSSNGCSDAGEYVPNNHFTWRFLSIWSLCRLGFGRVIHNC